MKLIVVTDKKLEASTILWELREGLINRVQAMADLEKIGMAGVLPSM